ncbi:unnamed protein product [Thlaspi arvense]|uniref:Uncharacterized protein n=1 Tax=Thlaspi arvense TaxID=13288 RepID=A0AAU9RQU7_THLAR|nr:unnamed protein product [Thlaspi arvense]
MGFDPTALKFVEALRVLYAYSDKTIEERVCFYGRLGLSVGDVWEMFKKCPFFLNFSEKKIAQTFETLKKCGLLEEEILSVFKTSPRCIGTSEQGIATSVETFIGLGFSRDEFAAMVKHFPSSLNYSAETVKKKSEFVVNQMKWPLKAVALFPQVLGYSFEKRIVPRCNVIKALLSRGLLRNKLPPLSTVLAITDQAFLNKYVKKLDDEELVNELMGYLHQSSCFKDQKGL